MTLFANFNLVPLRDTMCTVTFSSTYKPAKMSTLEFPGGAFVFYRTKFFFPTGSQSGFFSAPINQQEKNLSFDMTGDCSPALFVTVDRFKRRSKELSQFFLRFSKFFSSNAKFFFCQRVPRYVSLLL